MRLVELGGYTFDADSIAYYRGHGSHSVELQLRGVGHCIYIRSKIEDFEKAIDEDVSAFKKFGLLNEESE